jgi:hypothetical protein
MPRFQKALPQLKQVYERIIVSVPPTTDSAQVKALENQPDVSVGVPPDWSWGRHMAIQKFLETSASHVHYTDMDRALRWIETQPLELRCIVENIQKTDCLIIGRTEKAFQTHPRALRETESIVNLICSYLLGQTVDMCGGSRGFSRHAVQFLATNSPLGRAIGTDAEWPILLARAGFSVGYLAVDGLDWEVPDHYRQEAADPDTQRHIADEYDKDTSRWVLRVGNALEIVKAGLSAAQQTLVSEQRKTDSMR